MTARVNRRYHSPERTARANETRKEILEGARRLFSARGYGRTTMEAVAAGAGVSVATVYLAFRTKLGLLSALLADAAEDPRLDVQQVVAAKSAEQRAALGARNIRELHERTSAITALLRAGVGNDARLEKLWEKWQAGHFAAVAQVARKIAATGELRPDLNADDAADVLYVLTGSETYRQLVIERGWSGARYEEWLVDSMRRLLQ
ncbi:MAG: TetR/AcrR family transcriptional regulator [Candidatus Dormibacteraeota bacterium]|nr:TetR/AcrR family transcriptional regulator [Candidatus Dormibacteraeota bacterium]